MRRNHAVHPATSFATASRTTCPAGHLSLSSSCPRNHGASSLRSPEKHLLVGTRASEREKLKVLFSASSSSFPRVQKVTPRPPKRYAHSPSPLPSKKEKKLWCSSKMSYFTLPINPNLIVEGTSPKTHYPRGLILQEQPSEGRKTHVRVTTRASTSDCQHGASLLLAVRTSLWEYTRPK
ncbi:hypothetical protein GW17_00028225 [Ensete ventricosum]|nr:hypothetical protein GW17_00028225 [Ensete ventricosum]